MRHPAQLVSVAFATAILVGTGLLLLPVATDGAGGASFLTAAFTSTSAICVTGLIVVDTPGYWSTFGEVVIMLLVQIGGLGIMTLASALFLLVARRMGLRTRLVAQAETGALELGDVRRILVGVTVFSLLFELLAATVLALRFALSYDYSAGSAVYHGVFHAITAFNNAGFALWSDNLAGFVTDGWVSVTVSLAVVAGGIGFPVWLELRRELSMPRRWSLHTKLTLLVTGVLLAVGFVTVLGFEWTNPDTLGPLDWPGKLLASFFQGVQPRTAGFNTLDYGAMDDETLLVQDFLMLVGTGSAGTGGGIKVTTLAVLVLMVWAELRGEPEVNVFGRRLPAVAQRQALAVTLIAIAAVALCTLVLVAVSDATVSRSVFEAASAFGTVGLSTGITAGLPVAGKVALIVLMYLGRVGPLGLGTALVLRERARRYRNAEERPIIG
ncbi:MAG: TrkH family potassium uptake protein [Thermoleophilia bacterium]|nr:TrkH family potassium uptake protein [Thermoleophilia bacterium]